MENHTVVIVLNKLDTKDILGYLENYEHGSELFKRFSKLFKCFD